MKKIVLSWVVSVLGIVGILAVVGHDILPNTWVATGPSQGIIRAEFTLQTAEGRTVDARDYRGQYLLVYFGYTHCPDVCPTTLLLMQNALKGLGDLAARVQPVFISIDPERDSPEIAATYAKNFSARVIGLSGSPQQVKEAADHFKVYYSKVEDTDSALGYVVDHSGFIYLIGPDGNYLTHFAGQTSERALVEGLKKYVR